MKSIFNPLNINYREICTDKRTRIKVNYKIFSTIHNLCDSLRGQVPLNEYINKERRKKLNLNFMKKTKKLGLKHLKKENKNQRNKKRELVIICMIVVIGITFFSGASVGKAVYNSNIKNSTKIAKPILEVEKGSEIIITKDNKKGEYTFTVKNYNQEEISQVDLTYYVEILENDIDNSIQYQLYKDDEILELKENRTETMVFHKDVKEKQIYVLKVTYDDSKNAIEDIMQDIQIKVHSEQMKV